MFPRRAEPIWHLSFDGAPAIARLGFTEGASRAVISVAVPLDAFAALDSARAVSFTYTAGAFLALMVTLSAARMERVVLRKWITTLGFLANLTACVVFMFADGATFVAGIACLAAGASLFSTTLSLYIMENVTKAELTRSESTRLRWAGGAWFLGPFAGVLLREYVAPGAPYLLSITLSLVALFYFWALRLGTNPVLTTPAVHPPNPLRSIQRFFGQRYMRIAYCITLVRSTVWVVTFLYGSAYVVAAGLPAWASGASLSVVAGLLLGAPLVARVAEARSTRFVVGVSFGLVACGLGFVAALSSPHPIGLAGWAVAALGASSLDVVGNIPFMRTVKRRDRIAMTGVFSTWRDTSAILAPGLAALILSFADLRVFYLVLALTAALTATLSTLLPRRL